MIIRYEEAIVTYGDDIPPYRWRASHSRANAKFPMRPISIMDTIPGMVVVQQGQGEVARLLGHPGGGRSIWRGV